MIALHDDDALAVAAAQGTREDQGNDKRPDSAVPSQRFQGNDFSSDAETHARFYLERVQAGMAEPGELSALMVYLVEEAVQGACRTLERAMGVRK